MSYSETVLTRAMKRLEERQGAHQAEQEARRLRIYRKEPELREIDRKLRETIPQVIAAAFRKGEDPQKALEVLRRENQSLQQRRLELMKQHGFLESDLEETPLCPLCEDSGWRGATMCRCLKALCAQEQIRELSSLLNLGEQSFDRFRLDVYGEEVWPQYKRSPRKNMEAISGICKSFAANFGKSSVKNLLFYGAPGLGKTFLSACIAREVSENGASVVYDSAGTIFSRFEEQKFSRDIEDVRLAKDLTRKYLRCDLLILDDLGSELTTPFVQSALYQLVNSRLVEGRCTIISTNLTVDELSRKYTPQIASRLLGEYERLPFFGEDLRLSSEG